CRNAAPTPTPRSRRRSRSSPSPTGSRPPSGSSGTPRRSCSA
ncbi:MAG: hypothetical protein AVDCRST_MAG30-3088, partial [uncultured Solirubrobacteraceae bacterium]